MCGCLVRASARTSRRKEVAREGVSTRTRLAATSVPRHRASVISPEDPFPRTVPTASDAPSAGSAAVGAPAEAPALGAPTSSSAASISQPPARAASTSAGRDAHGSSGLPEIALSVVAIGEFAVELLGVRRSGSEAEDAEPRGGGTRCSRQESARALAARHPGRRARDRLCSPPFANRSSAFSRREKKIRDSARRRDTENDERSVFRETPRT